MRIVFVCSTSPVSRELVEVSGLEPKMTEPKSVVLPLHHTSKQCRLFPSCQPCRKLTLYVLARGPLFGRIGAIQREAPPARATPTTPYSRPMPIRSPGKETRFILRPPATWRTPEGGQADRGLVRIETTIQTGTHTPRRPFRRILWLNIMFVRKSPANRIDRAWYKANGILSRIEKPMRKSRFSRLATVIVWQAPPKAGCRC